MSVLLVHKKTVRHQYDAALIKVKVVVVCVHGQIGGAVQCGFRPPSIV